jgi:uncharacterized membrane protein YeaQ/YmgE (transglycosylase-associated protein family)
MKIPAVIAWLVIGFVIGGLAHLLVPGRQRIGVLRTLPSGIAGAMLGGFITVVLIGPGHVINTLIIALVVSALLARAVTRPGYDRLESRARRLLR